MCTQLPQWYINMDMGSVGNDQTKMLDVPCLFDRLSGNYTHTQMWYFDCAICLTCYTYRTYIDKSISIVS